MMKSFISIGWLLSITLLWSTACAQGEAQQICVNPKFDKKVANTLSHTVDFISPAKLAQIKQSAFVLDTREQEEYDISHIPNAHYASYSDFDITPFLSLPRDTTLVVYCSIGYRSEKIGEQLLEAGFSKVFNLYGSLFEWANQNYPLEDKEGNTTNKVHTYNKKWSQWVDDNGKLVKIW